MFLRNLLKTPFWIYALVCVIGCENNGKSGGNETEKTEKDTPTGLFHPNNDTNSLRSIKIFMKEGSIVQDSLKKTVDSAFVIANAVFNSADFQSALRHMNFKFTSNCRNGSSCKKNMKDNGQRIPGTTVLDSLFKESPVYIKFYLEQRGDALGSTCPGTYAMTAYFENILTDMQNDSIPRAAKIAVNICHEYMHQVGYCHIYGKLNEPGGNPDARYINEDVTYWVGWEAFYILTRWQDARTQIPGL